MKKLSQNEIKQLQDIFYELELQTGIVSSEEITENTNIEEYINNIKVDFSEMPYFLDGFNEIYYNELNESTNRTFMEILNDFKK